MQKNKAEAENLLRYWCDRAIESKLPAMVKVANTIGKKDWYSRMV